MVEDRKEITIEQEAMIKNTPPSRAYFLIGIILQIIIEDLLTYKERRHSVLLVNHLMD